MSVPAQGTGGSEVPDDGCPEIIASRPSQELCTRLIVAIIANGPANDNEAVVKMAARYLEYTMILSGSWKPHPLRKNFTVDLSTIESRAR